MFFQARWEASPLALHPLSTVHKMGRVMQERTSNDGDFENNKIIYLPSGSLELDLRPAPVLVEPFLLVPTPHSTGPPSPRREAKKYRQPSAQMTAHTHTLEIRRSIPPSGDPSLDRLL